MGKKVVHHHHSSGIGLGTLLAGLISWQINKSVLWVILHAILGWFYVIYFLMGCAGSLPS